MSITPIDIQQHRFKTRPLGYDKSGVDSFLEQVADELERFHLEVQKLKEELSRTRDSLDEMKQREVTLKETLLTAQRMTDELKANASKEAEIIVAEAELKGEKIVQEARNRHMDLLSEIQELRRQKVSFESGLRAVVESHMRLLDMNTLSIQDAGRFQPVLMEILEDDASAQIAPPAREDAD
ncbi:cell division protein DivIVA, putative [Syntrophotalea carbinolica DSM 2380]|uniref:Cell division protein DivIVA, putative n=1 Tax=Syntrophotalea carbinolica (strain DSM 2380 / NBRC 103641 / GraBd1) TaxID=338963 RepID=Q3A6Y2_SYNC1|nr:DivIVA domain-containing protein [Syntrophotalea carbinolica]ABA87875.1 cell division protein DivIVA, putative [Syntrophotalea carbinolica DSM 2380]